MTAVITLEGDNRSHFLDESTLAELEGVAVSVLGNPEVETVCVCSAGPDFLSGVDLTLFTRAQVDGDLERILKFTRDSHQLLSQIERSTKPVVAWVRGPAVGAGLELALACHAIVAEPNAKFCFPEAGLGIYPGLGGTQRLPRRVGVGLAKWMIYTGAIVSAQQAFEIGLVDVICPTAKGAEQAIASLAGIDSTRLPLSDRFRSLESLFARQNVATLVDPAFEGITDAHGVRALVQMRGKAPLALRLAEQIIDRGMQLPLDQGIEEEFSHLRDVFSSQDARLGLMTASGQRPRFTGQ